MYSVWLYSDNGRFQKWMDASKQLGVSFLLFFYPPADLVIWRQDRRIRAMLVTRVDEAAGCRDPSALDFPSRRAMATLCTARFADAPL